MVPLFFSASSLLPPSATGISAADAAHAATAGATATTVSSSSSAAAVSVPLVPTKTEDDDGSTSGSAVGAGVTVVTVHVSGVGHVDVVCDGTKGPRVVNRDGTTGYLQNWNHLNANEQHRAHALAEVAAGNHRNLGLLLKALYESKEDPSEEELEAEDWNRVGDDGFHTREYSSKSGRSVAAAMKGWRAAVTTRRRSARRRLDFGDTDLAAASVSSAAATRQWWRCDRAPL